MRSICCIFFAGIFLVLSCGKKNKTPEETPAPIQETPVPDTGLKCQDLPPPPQPFGWIDSMPDPNKIINSFLFHPLDPDKIIYVVNGDVQGYNKLYFYTIPTQQAQYVCTLGEYLPQVNKKGWITFSDVDNNICLVKNPGEGVIKLTSDKRSRDPKWDYTGNFIYYYGEAHDIIISRLYKMDTEGHLQSEISAELPYSASFKKTDKLIILKTKDNTCNLILREPDAPENDRLLISGPMYSKPGQISFDNLVLDNNDEFFYWSNSNGIFRCNLASLKVDTMLKNCQNFIYDNPIISFKDHELTYSHHILKPLNVIKLEHQFKTMEMDLLSRQITEIRIFP